ncbi:MAG: amidohydrolase/deacetylase family metallohydrolase [Candidatus Tectomicrobia bacterium]|nr:amidohydrolase/deacetylase family metallohydrolase [Candidatus Tectomicrobia bacterium]
MPYDLLLKGGEVIDPGQGIHEQLDVAISEGQIAALSKNIATGEAVKVVDVLGKLVTPGLIDYHAHVFIGTTDMGLKTDAICSASGVTTLVDCGSSGAGTFEGLRRYIIEPSKTRILAFVNISNVGLLALGVGELLNLQYISSDQTISVINEHREIALGIKARIGREIVGSNGIEPLRLARQAADMAGVPLMVHVTNSPVPLSQILAILREGDVVTHFLNGRPNGILSGNGDIIPEVWEARDRGILFDSAHGRGHVNFHVARAALAERFFPDLISTDLTLSSHRNGPVYDLPTTLSKFLNLGMTLDGVIERSTAVPARLIGQEGKLGTLKAGAIADISLFELQQGSFEFRDSDGNTMTGEQKLVCSMTIKDGNVWYRP